MSDVITVIEGLDLVVSMADGHLHPDDLEAARVQAAAARDRSGYLGTTVVLALVGGTGSGKSSLLNALAGETVASVAVTRPHTSEPLAWIPAEEAGPLDAMLDRLGVARRIRQTRFPGIAILDMADIDSVESSHRAQVEALLPEVDVVVWVLDPVKYADVDLHRDLIEPLADSARRFVFVLNRIDELSDDEVTRVRQDLERLLTEDGVVDPIVFETAAMPSSGSPRGVDRLAAFLASRLDEKRAHLGKVVADARLAARTVAAAAGVADGGSLDFETRWEQLRDAAVSTLSISGPTVGAFDEVLCAVEDLVSHLSAEAGGPFGTRLRQTFTPERLADDLRQSIRVMEEAVPRGKDGAVSPERRAAAAEVLDGELQVRLGAQLRKVLWERASLSAVVAGLAVDASLAEAGLTESDA